MLDVFELEPFTKIGADDSYILSYPHLLSYFASKVSFRPEDVVCGAHMVYGWMPTILDLYPKSSKLDFVAAANLLNVARNSGDLTDFELGKLAALINNSLVGASKLLHFSVPSVFPIWDSKVYAFLFNKKPNGKIAKVELYRQYQATLKELQKDRKFDKFHESVNSKIGYDVSPVRAIELIMYLNAPSL